MRALTLALACLACGGKPTPKQPPAPLAPKELAKLLDSDMATLGDIAQRKRGDCAAMTADLRPLVDRMKLHAVEVDRMVQDPVKARELRSELARYSETARNDRMATDLGATYLACASDERYQLERVISNIPTYD